MKVKIVHIHLFWLFSFIQSSKLFNYQIEITYMYNIYQKNVNYINFFVLI